MRKEYLDSEFRRRITRSLYQFGRQTHWIHLQDWNPIPGLPYIPSKTKLNPFYLNYWLHVCLVNNGSNLKLFLGLLIHIQLKNYLAHSPVSTFPASLFLAHLQDFVIETPLLSSLSISN